MEFLPNFFMFRVENSDFHQEFQIFVAVNLCRIIFFSYLCGGNSLDLGSDRQPCWTAMRRLVEKNEPKIPSDINED